MANYPEPFERQYQSHLKHLKLKGLQPKTIDAYARAIGLAFQITDDILDIEGDTATLGKPQGSDQKHAKPTYPALLGLERARALAREQHAVALESLRTLGDNGQLLGEIADFILDRTH